MAKFRATFSTIRLRLLKKEQGQMLCCLQQSRYRRSLTIWSVNSKSPYEFSSICLWSPWQALNSCMLLHALHSHPLFVSIYPHPFVYVDMSPLANLC